MSDHSNVPSPRVSRLQLWVARLVLLGASIGSVATSMTPKPFEGPILELAPVSVTTASPQVVRRFAVQVTAKESLDFPVHLYVTGLLAAEWRPSVSTDTRTPRVRMRLSPDSEQGPSTASEWTEFSSAPETPRRASLGTAPWINEKCSLTPTCTSNLRLEIELDPRGAEGTVYGVPSVELEAEAYDGREMKGLSFMIVEE